MKHYESIILGHITKDTDIDYLGNKVDTVGGAVLFSSASAYALGHKVAIITKIAPKDSSRLSSFTAPQEDTYIILSKLSVDMENKYLSSDKELRSSTCTSFGEQFTIDDIPEDIEADIYHFAGLLYGDFPDEMIKECSKKGAVALDVQSCLRHADKKNGKISICDWENKKEILPYITYLKTDAQEAEALTGTSDRYESAKLLHEWGAKEVIITHNSEVIAYDGDKLYTCPVKARNLIGRTGRGDTTFAAYINEHLTRSVNDSLLIATATSSLKMESAGPLHSSRKDINSYIKKFYKN